MNGKVKFIKKPTRHELNYSREKTRGILKSKLIYASLIY